MENACGALKEIVRHPDDLVAVRLDALQQAELSIHLVECGVCQATLAGFCQQENSHTLGFKVVIRLCLMAVEKIKKQGLPHLSLKKMEDLLDRSPGVRTLCETIGMLNEGEGVERFLAVIRSLSPEQKWNLIWHHASCTPCHKIIGEIMGGSWIVAGDQNNTPAQNALLELITTPSC